MLYTSRNLQINRLNDISRLLENANYLTEQECIYRPEMVPIRENLRIGKDVIRLEDFVDYALANGITEGGYALAQICESSGVSQDNIVFSVDEVSVLEDGEMEDTVRQLLEKGQTVYTCPISSNDIAYILAESVTNAADICLSQGNEDYCDELIEAYINDRFDILLSENYIVESVFDTVKNKVGSWIDGAKSTAKNLKDKIIGSASDARNWAARKISSLRTIARNKLDVAEDRAGHLGDNVKGMFNRGKNFVTNNANLLKTKINNGIEYLGKKLKRKKMQESADSMGDPGLGKGIWSTIKNKAHNAIYGTQEDSGNKNYNTLRSGIQGRGSNNFGTGSITANNAVPGGNGRCSGSPNCG